MEFIAVNWWLWLIVTCFFGALALRPELKTFKGYRLPFSGSGFTFFFTIVALAGGLTFTVSVIINVITSLTYRLLP